MEDVGESQENLRSIEQKLHNNEIEKKLEKVFN
mgnify:CR=1 FL=1